MCAIAHEQHEQGEGRRESLHVDICEKDFNVGDTGPPKSAMFSQPTLFQNGKAGVNQRLILMYQRPYRAPIIVAGAIMRMLPQGA